jgi:O-succinylbenzoate synthase
MMKIERIDIHHVALPLVAPFETSFGREDTIEHLILSVHADGIVGWGECVADRAPWYSPETNGTATHILRDVLAPLLFKADITAPGDVVRCFQRVRGHPMARAALESAIWDWFGRAQERSLAQMLGVQRERVPVGVSIGIEPTVNAVVERVAAFVGEGYGRVKLKIKPGFDVTVVRAVRERWPDLLLQVDANSAYTLSDSAVLRELDSFGLLLIEQPLHHEDIVDHARLQQQITTPICLDESIHSPDHARWALDIGACRVINIKVGRVGGITAAQHIHDLCAARSVPVWCGGMLETNVGRAVNLALAGLPNFTLPGDISASARYYQRDIAIPDFALNSDSTITIPHTAGIGVDIDYDYLAAACQRYICITPQ